MPPIIRGATFPGDKGSFVNADDLKRLKGAVVEEYRDRYPKKNDKRRTPVNLKPGSELHDMIRDEIIQRAHEANFALIPRFDSWRRLDQVLTAYIPTDDAEKRIQSLDPRKPVSIVIPQGFATRETFLTYFVAALLEDPIYKYDGVGPEDAVGAILMQHVVSHQARKFKHLLKLNGGFSDAVTYGIGGWWINWEKKEGLRTRRGDIVDLEGSLIESRRRRERVTLFEGNDIDNVDPYLMLSDPNMSVDDAQKGEFDGRLDQSTYLSLLEQEATNLDLFNVQYLQIGRIHGRSFLNTELRTGRDDKKGTPTRGKRPVHTTRPIDIIRMQIQLIPSEWKTEDGSEALGDSDQPEKWEFALGADSVLIMARRMDHDHDMFTTAKCAPISDNHSSLPVSLLEIDYPMEHAINWMWNAHVANVRKVVNNIFAFNPKMINEFDLDNAALAGGKVRMRQAGWLNSKWSDHIGQLPVNDITRNNLGDIGFLKGFSDEVMGVTAQTRGFVPDRGERISATEVQGARTSAFSRFERMARLMGAQAIWDLAYIMASHTRQFMEQDVYVKLNGTLEEQLLRSYGAEGRIKNGRIQVSPRDIDVDYDIIGHDGTIPSLQGDPQTMVQMLQLGAQIPTVAQGIDFVKVFLQLARAQGINNVNDWLINQPQIEQRSNEEVVREREKGNLVPIEEVEGVEGGSNGL